MDITSNQVHTTSAFAGDEYLRVTCRHLGRQSTELPHRGTRLDDDRFRMTGAGWQGSGHDGAFWQERGQPATRWHSSYLVDRRRSKIAGMDNLDSEPWYNLCQFTAASATS